MDVHSGTERPSGRATHENRSANGGMLRRRRTTVCVVVRGSWEGRREGGIEGFSVIGGGSRLWGDQGGRGRGRRATQAASSLPSKVDLQVDRGRTPHLSHPMEGSIWGENDPCFPSAPFLYSSNFLVKYIPIGSDILESFMIVFLVLLGLEGRGVRRKGE